MNAFLSGSVKLFRYYQQLGEKAIAQLDDAHLNVQFNADSNSITHIVKHLSGNMLSRWTDFLHSDGEKPWRNRDDEFEGDISDKEALLQLWKKGWDCLYQALEPLSEADLSKKIYIRGEAQSVLDAINRQVAHYAYHVGQIVFLAKALKEGPWISLSIPKGQTTQFLKGDFQEKLKKMKEDK